MMTVHPRLLLFVLLTALAALPAAAHKPSDSYLHLWFEEDRIEGRWDLSLRDLEHAVGLDADLDGTLTWGEVRARHDAIAAYALARLRAETAAGLCQASAGEALIDHHSDGAYSVLPFTWRCPGDASADVELTYAFLFDLDPSHRGLVQIERGGRVQTAVLSPENASLLLIPQGRGVWPSLVDFFLEGVWHIWIGFDHLLFLMALLLPVVLRPSAEGWRPALALGPVLADVARIVTAFTVAHSLTLGLAALGWVSLPSRPVEVAIAGTVLLAALHNLRGGGWIGAGGSGAWRWQMAFVLGLVHGFGFAGVLGDLGLRGSSAAVALLGFNLGVEVGQLTVVALFVPLAFALRRQAFYQRGVLRFGSAAVAMIAFGWLVDRVFDLGWMPI